MLAETHDLGDGSRSSNQYTLLGQIAKPPHHGGIVATWARRSGASNLGCTSRCGPKHRGESTPAPRRPLGHNPTELWPTDRIGYWVQWGGLVTTRHRPRRRLALPPFWLPRSSPGFRPAPGAGGRPTPPRQTRPPSPRTPMASYAVRQVRRFLRRLGRPRVRNPEFSRLISSWDGGSIPPCSIHIV